MEYGMIIGLFGILTMGALQLLGNSVIDSLGGVKRSEVPIMRLASLDFGQPVSATVAGGAAGSVPLKGGGYYQVVIDPVTGQPILQLTDSNTGSVTNATSIEGAQWNSLGHFRLAMTLESLAKEQTNPAYASYLDKLANKAYYLGVAEGELDKIPGLNLADMYSRVDAFRDLGRLQGELQALFASPPAGISPAVMQEAAPLVADVHNIAQTYINALDMMGGPNTDFVLTGEDYHAGTGMPGLVLANLDKIELLELDPRYHGMLAEETIPLADVKKISQRLLSDNHVDSPLVEATLTNATNLDQQATTSP